MGRKRRASRAAPGAATPPVATRGGRVDPESRPAARVGTPRTAARPLAERLLPLWLAAAGLYAYHNSFNGPFVFDDLYAIERNTSIRQLWPLWDVLSPPRHGATTGRPLVNLSLALNYALGGLDVRVYHAFNILIHVLTSLVLFGTVRRILLSPTLRPRYAADASRLALAIALLWVVHPLASEGVSYVIQRTELLMSLFFLLTLYCANRGFEWAPAAGTWHVAALVAFAAGMGCKEVIVAVPIVVLVSDRLFWSGSWWQALARHWKLYGGLAAVFVLQTVISATRLRRAMLSTRPHPVSPWDYAWTQAGVLVHYLRLVLWPHPLVADYDDWPIATSVMAVLPWAIIITGLVAATVWALYRGWRLGFLGVWFFVILAPTSSFRPLLNEIAAERRMYLPLAAVVALIVLGGHALAQRLRVGRTAQTVVVVALAALLAQVTVSRNEAYRSTLAFWSDIVAKRPQNARARMWLGDHLYKNGRSAEALDQYAAAVRSDPEDPLTHYGLGVTLVAQKRIDEALDEYREALRLKPDYPQARNALANTLFGQGKLDEAVEQYRATIEIDPQHYRARYNLALVLARQGKHAEAVAQLEAALQIQPTFTAAQRALEDFRARQ